MVDKDRATKALVGVVALAPIFGAIGTVSLHWWSYR